MPQYRAYEILRAGLRRSDVRAGAHPVFTCACALLATLTAAAPDLSAQDADWENESELSYLLSGGNAGASTLGFRNTLTWSDENSEWQFKLTALRTDATEFNRFAEGSDSDDFVIREETETERTAERYSAETRYDQDISDRFFTFVGVGWNRNTFAGYDSRTVTSIGAGNQWGPGDDDWEVKLSYGATYTSQKDVIPNADAPSKFAGGRVELEYEHQFTESTGAEVEWIMDFNAKRGDDLRGEFAQSVTSALNSRLALKTTFELVWDNDPPLERIPLVLPGGEPTGDDVRVSLDPFDYDLSIALVLTL